MNEPLFLVGDSRQLEFTFKKNRLPRPSTIITSPPYSDVKNYDGIPEQIGYKQSYSDYIKDITSVFKQCHKISTDNATLWIVIDTVKKNGKTYPIPFDILNSLNSSDKNENDPLIPGWILRDIIIWNRSKSLPWYGKGRFKHEFEYILFLSKNEKYKYHIDRLRDVSGYKSWWLTYPERYNSCGRTPSNIWEFTTPIRGWGKGYQEHLCPFPFPLIERVLQLVSDEDDVVFDPFAGCGSTLALAAEMHRRAFGFDINSRYKIQFESEVKIGAKKYWTKRLKELEKIKTNNQHFTENNIKLRKIKLGLYLADVIRKTISVDVCIVIKDKENSKSSIILSIVPPINGSLDTSHIMEIKKGIPKSYKIDADINICQRGQLAKDFNSVNLFAYLPKKPYKYDHKLPVSLIAADGMLNGNFVYSDISLNIVK